ncbi:glycosyltransferase family 2 protein [bacterium]|nr:glycosyltransferase family 2 protein [bacterium]
MPKISIVVPVYNVGPYLSRCLDSLIWQSLKDIEIICVDDASTDDSLEILRGYAEKDKRIQVIPLVKNSGVATARNTGIDAASGEYIGFVDSDDCVDLDFYEQLYATATANGADMVRGSVRMVKYNGSSKIDSQELKDIQANGKWYFGWQWWAAIYSRRMIVDNNIRFPVDVISGQDTVFLVACLKHSNDVALCWDTHYNYIRRADSLDEPIMPPHKIASRIKAYKLVSDIYNSSSMSNKDYTNRYALFISWLCNHLNRNTQRQCKIDIAEAMIDMYMKSKSKAQIAQQLLNYWSEEAVRCLQSLDAEGLIAALNKEWQKKLAGNQTAYSKSCFTFNLFGFIPVLKISTINDTKTVKLFGIRIYKSKLNFGKISITVLYLPLMKIRVM